MIEDYEEFEGIKGVIRSYKSMKDIRVQCRKLKKKKKFTETRTLLKITTESK